MLFYTKTINSYTRIVTGNHRYIIAEVKLKPDVFFIRIAEKNFNISTTQLENFTTNLVSRVNHF